MLNESTTEGSVSSEAVEPAPANVGQAETTSDNDAHSPEENPSLGRGNSGHTKKRKRGEFIPAAEILEQLKNDQAPSLKAKEDQVTNDISEDQEIPKGDEIEVQEEEAESDSEDTPSFLELEHKGEVKKVSKEEALELAQKGLDYTKKTMGLAEERKAFEVEKGQVEELLNQKVAELEETYKNQGENTKLYQEWDYVLSSMKESDPGLYEEIVTYKDSHVKQLNNPMYQAMQEQLAQQAEMLKKLTQVHTDEQVRSSYHSELSDVKSSYASQLEGLGINVDWDGKVKEAWLEGEPLNLSVKDAFLKEYGDQIIGRFSSRSKVENLKKKVEAQKVVPTAGTARRASKLPDMKNYRRHKGSRNRVTDYGAITRDIISGNLPV